MSIRMALAKLSALAATGAMVGGGAVHVAEPSAKDKGYVKHLKQVKQKPVQRTVIARAQPRTVKRMRKIVRTETNRVCAPQQDALMAVPLPAPFLPQLPSSSGGSSGAVLIGGGPIGGFGGGGFFGGFFGGSSGGGGGSVVVSSTSTGSTSTSGGSSSTSSGGSGGSSTSTSSGGITSSTTTGEIGRAHV